MAPIENTRNISIETFNEIISAGVSSKLIYEGSICDSYPCLNDGVCIELFNQSLGEHGRAYKCVCNKMFEGHDCEVKTSTNNCTTYPCTFDPLCLPHFPSVRCLPMLSQSNCSCLNGGICLHTPNFNHQPTGHQRCLCPNNFIGVLCELSTGLNTSSKLFPKNFITTSISSPHQSEWSVLQSIFVFASLIIFAATLLAFCYGCNHTCYLLLPSFRKKRSSLSKRARSSSPKYAPFPAIFRRVNEYEVGNQYFLEDDLFGCEDEDLIGGVEMFKGIATQSMRDHSQHCSNYMEMKTKPSFMKVSSTAESFITYDAKDVSGRHTHNLSSTNNSDGQGPSTPVYI